MTWRELRRDRVTRPVFRWARGALPSLSDTERDALEAGETWWDAALFSGDPDWRALAEIPPARLTEAEQAFLDGPCTSLCALIDDWRINFVDGDLPPEVWRRMREERFFGMIIPEEYGGLGFSAYAHSEVVRRISTRSLAAGVTVMVPNSLGPGELLMQFGTQAQRDHWLPRLARGEEIPAFALTSEEAGSDASAMRDSGVVERGTWRGEEVLGIRLNWSKRYITLGPVATVLGLAFKLRDPEGLLGGAEDRGVTCALVPTGLEGVEIGRRHIPSGQMFLNGPNQGHDVFIPLDHVIGGEGGVGEGWKMLMSALAAGRGISLPSQASGAAALAAHSAGAYARVRTQFGLPVGRFEGVQAELGALASGAYALDAARRMTCAGLDQGRRLAVISGIMKAHATYRMRDALDSAMDVHGGKTVMDGPRNHLGNFHRGVPIAITVEGANILTRSMIIFGQGAIRCHPHLLDEMLALETEDEGRALDAFDKAFWAHVGHSTRTFFRALGRAWTGARAAPSPGGEPELRRHYQRMSRYAAALALFSDIALLRLGGELKRREMLSARLGDVLSELYFLSALLKRWQDEGRRAEDLPLVHHAAESGFARIRMALEGAAANFPGRLAGPMLRAVTLCGGRSGGPSDALTRECAELLLSPSETRERIASGLAGSCEGEALHALERAFALTVEVEPIRRRLAQAKLDVEAALEAGELSAAEAERLAEAEAAAAEACAVDDFAPEEIGRAVDPAPGARSSASELSPEASRAAAE